MTSPKPPENWVELLAKAQRAITRGHSIREVNEALKEKGAPSYDKLVQLARTSKATPDYKAFSPGDVLRSEGQGASMGWLDEIMGALAASGGGAEGGGGHPELYQPVRDDVRSADASFESDHPGVALGSKLVGAMGTGLVSGGAAAPLLQGASALGRVGAGAVMGAGAGAVQGAGQAQDASDILPQAGEGAATGAAGGLVLGTGAELLGGLMSGPGAWLGRKIGTTVAPSWMARRNAARAVREAAKAAGIELDETALESTSGERLAKLGQHLAQLKEPIEQARAIAQARLAKISAESYKPLDEAFQVMKKDPRLDAVIDDPEVSKLWRAVTKTGKDTPGFSHFQELRQLMGKEISPQNRTITPALRTHLINMKGELTNVLEDMVPGYQEANQRYLQTATTVGAFKDGSEAYTKGVGARAVKEQMAHIANRAGPEADDAIDAYRHGLIAAMVKKMVNPGPKGPAAALLRSRKEALREAFPTQAEFEQFVRAALNEGRFAERLGKARSAALDASTASQDLTKVTVPELLRRVQPGGRTEATARERILTELLQNPTPSVVNELRRGGVFSGGSQMNAPAAMSPVASPFMQFLLDQIGKH